MCNVGKYTIVPWVLYGNPNFTPLPNLVARRELGLPPLEAARVGQGCSWGYVSHNLTSFLGVMGPHILGV